ncbi:MAG: hypothetical protein ACRD5G_03115 [Candidatus Acidiferrales bacterium]
MRRLVFARGLAADIDLASSKRKREFLAVNSLLLLLLLGGALLTLLLLALLRGAPTRQAPASFGRVAEIVPLPGLSFSYANRLFDPSDYADLRGSAISDRLVAAASDERKRLALLWLRLMREDVRTLWRFRRAMAAYGVSAGPLDELRVALAGTGIGFLQALRVSVSLFGPFRLAAFGGISRAYIEDIHRVSATLFDRIPPSRRPEFEGSWKVALATDFVFPSLICIHLTESFLDTNSSGSGSHDVNA